jgi:multiple sugar transport system ATP-binding protein
MFVGGFIGNPPMNFLEAKVVTNGGAPVVHLSGGSFPLPGAGVESLVGRRLVLGIRAESIGVEREPASELVRATVLVVEPLGSHNLLTVGSGEDTLKISTSPDLFPDPESDIWLRLTPERIRWMDAETRSAIETGAERPPESTVMAAPTAGAANP